MTPEMHDRVRLRDSDDTFVVIGVDYGRQVVDLAPADGVGATVEEVPFDELEGLALPGSETGG